MPGYRLGTVLGRGGFATVYRARPDGSSRIVALKLLASDLATPGDRERFRREHEALTRLRGMPGVVEILDTGISPAGHPYLVMPFYGGGNLGDLVAREGPLTVGEVVELVAPLAEALDAAHAVDVLHRDVKPHNVLLAEDGRPVLADFGIAALLPGEPGAARASTRFFTPAYVAPEVLAGARPTRAADVYSLAATAYELLAGRPPFDPDDPRIASRILDDRPDPLDRPDAGPAVAEVLDRALSKDPGDRPPSAGSFAEALARAAAPADDAPPPGTDGASSAGTDGAPPAGTDGGPDRPTRPRTPAADTVLVEPAPSPAPAPAPEQGPPGGRRRLLALAAALVLLVTVAGIGAAVRLGGRDHERAETVPTTAASSTSGTPTGTPTGTATGTAGRSPTGAVDRQQALIDAIPEGIVDRSTCRARTDIETAAVGVTCTATAPGKPGRNDPTTIDAYRFESASTMLDDLNSRNYKSAKGDCKKSTWSFGDGPTVGHQLCFVNRDDEAVQVWTFTGQRIELYAYGRNTDTSALHAWWKQEPGYLLCPPGTVDDPGCG